MAKRLLVSVGTVALALLPACARKEEPAKPPRKSYRELAAALDEGPRLAERYPLGVELYSWKTTEGTWRFSLMVEADEGHGIEAITDAEIRIEGAPALKKRLARLAKAEEVSWWDAPSGELGPGRQNPFSYPPKEMFDDINAHCTQLGISLHRF